MDTTPIADLLRKLETADPAEAPDIADEVTAALAATLDQPPADATDQGEVEGVDH